MAIRTYEVKFAAANSAEGAITHTVTVSASGGFTATLRAGAKAADLFGAETASGLVVKSVDRLSVSDAPRRLSVKRA